MPSELKKPVPFGTVTVRRLSRRHENHVDQYNFYPAGHSPYTDNVDECHIVYTDAQLEQYAADRVREALERAARQIESGCPPLARRGNRIEIGHDARQAFADAIRTLKEQTK